MTVAIEHAREERLARTMVPVAASLAEAVAEEDQDAVAATLTPLSVGELYALAVVLAAHIDPDLPLQRRTSRGTAHQALRHAASAFGIEPDEVMGTSRRQEVLDARAVTYYAANLAGQGYSAIGRTLARDHSTVINGCARVGQTPRLREIAQRIAERLDWESSGGGT